MTKEEHKKSLVNARRACLMLVGYAVGEYYTLILDESQREEVACLLEEFGRLDKKERKQAESGKKGAAYGNKEPAPGKRRGRPPTKKAKNGHKRAGNTGEKLR